MGSTVFRSTNWTISIVWVDETGTFSKSRSSMTTYWSFMLRRSLDAFVNRDIVSATAVCNEDDEVDDLYD